MCDLGMPCEAAVKLLRRCRRDERAFHLAERFGLRGEIPMRVSVCFDVQSARFVGLRVNGDA